MKHTSSHGHVSTPLVVLCSAMTSVFVVSAVALTGQVTPDGNPPVQNGTQEQSEMQGDKDMHRGSGMQNGFQNGMQNGFQNGMHNGMQNGMRNGMNGQRDMEHGSAGQEFNGEEPSRMQWKEKQMQMQGENRSMPSLGEMERGTWQKQEGQDSSATMQWKEKQMMPPSTRPTDSSSGWMQGNNEEMMKRMMMEKQKRMIMEKQKRMEDQNETLDASGDEELGVPQDQPTESDTDHPAASYSSDGSATGIPAAGYEEEIVETTVNMFSDVEVSDEVGAAANYLAATGVVGGFPDGTFRPDEFINRAQAAKFLVLARVGQVPEMPSKGMFADVPDGQWYTKFVVSASSMGIINGYKDHTFGPAKQVNTAEFLKMLSLTFGLQATGTSTYDDVPADAWFAKFAAVAQEQELLPNREGSLDPSAPITRGEAAYAIAKIMQDTAVQE